MDINTLQELITYFENKLWKVAPHGVLPSGEVVEPDYQNETAQTYLEVIRALNVFLEIEDMRMDTYHKETTHEV